MFVISVTRKDIPFVYAKIYLLISLLDAILFWLMGHSPLSIFAWILFTTYVARVAIAYLLYRGVPQRNVLKCKVFCVGEVIIILLGMIILIIQLPSIGEMVWFFIVVFLRVYGLRLIGTFIRMVETELGLTSTFPWTYFPEPIDAKNQVQIAEYPEQPTT